jgi:hypothetical protein
VSKLKSYLAGLSQLMSSLKNSVTATLLLAWLDSSRPPTVIDLIWLRRICCVAIAWWKAVFASPSIIARCLLRCFQNAAFAFSATTRRSWQTCLTCCSAEDRHLCSSRQSRRRIRNLHREEVVCRIADEVDVVVGKKG